MKTTLKSVLVIAAIALCSNISAQTLKLAHINMEELIVSMPEYDSAMVKLQKLEKELTQALEDMNVDRNRKLDDFTKNSSNWSELVRGSKEQEIISMNQRIQAFQEQAQETMQQDYQKLMQPVQEKANKAIESVAKEQGITYVISANTQILIFKAVGTVDLLPAVKQHLGIKK
jgi:outer membrane protein